MITVLTGAPGHGKTYTSIKLIDGYVHEGKCVVTNVPLREDFALQMARVHTPFWRLRPKAVERREQKIAERVLVCTDLQEIMRVRFSGKGEGRAKVVIDESHREMNVRGTTRGKSDEAKQRKAVVAYASGHRHYGVDLVLITQALSNLDLQIRNLLEFHSEVRNFRKLMPIGALARFLPGGQLFLRATYWNDRARTKAGISIYWLNKRLAGLYDTHGLEEADWPENAILMPSHPASRLALPETTTNVHGDLTPPPTPATI